MAKMVKAKLVLLEVPEDKRERVIEVLRSELGIEAKDAIKILDKLPKEILSSIPFEAAELVASSFIQAGAKVEVVMDAGRFCDFHPHKLARAKCKKCGKYICEIDILQAKKRLFCPECYEKRQFLARLLILVGVLIIILGAIAYAAVMPYIKKVSQKLQAQRTKTLAFVVFANGSDPERVEVFNKIAAPDVAEQAESIYAIPKLLSSEFTRYTDISSDIISASVLGVFMVSPDNPPPSGLDEAELKKYLRGILSAERIDEGDYQLFVFVFLCKSKDLFGAGYHEAVNVVDNYALVYFPCDKPDKIGFYLASTAWAVAQLLGAKPKVPASPVDIPSDIESLKKGENQLETFAEISYGLKLDSSGRLVPVSSLSEVRVGSSTAREMNWVKKPTKKR